MVAFTCISPIDGRVVAELALATASELERVCAAADAAAVPWAAVPLDARMQLVSRLVDEVVAESQRLARELTLQMGRPSSQTPSELRGFEERARYMLSVAPAALAAVQPAAKPGFVRYMERVPLGPVLTLAPWNYPWLTAVNAVVPALVAGNPVVLKHSEQTPLVAERWSAAAQRAGLPEGVFQFVHCSHEQVARLVSDPRIQFVAFTGSVAGGHAVVRATADRFVGCGLELGGKDAAYVRADADLEFSVSNLVDGTFYNSGQSCCAVERLYVHEAVFDRFVEAFVAGAKQYRLGNPLEADTTLGPLVRLQAADHVRGQIAEALQRGARALVDPTAFPAAQAGTPYLAPQVLVGVDHGMQVMREETFGPVVGIMSVSSDEQAIGLMNDSRYGLTASVWTTDNDAAVSIGQRVHVGTWFQNRCDYLDPALAWTGIKDSGRGVSLSTLGYEVLTRPKSFHLRQ